MTNTITVWDTLCGSTARCQTVWEQAKELIQWVPSGYPYASTHADLQSIIDAGEVDIADDDDHESIESAIETLQELCPDYTYLEWRDGELMCVPNIEGVEHKIDEGHCLRVGDLSDLPDDYLGLVAIVNCRGNMTFGNYHPAIGFAEYWSVV